MNSLVHIVPQLPPAIDGVGDYCWNLWRHWPERDDTWHFAALRNSDQAAQHWPEVAVHGFQPNAESLQSALENIPAQTAVLHYVGYGFQPKGIPRWLPVALERWRSGKSSRRLVTMFHEMYARSSPFRSPFWVAPWARKIIRELVALSDTWVTSCDRYFNQIVASFQASPECGQLIPIGSNIPLAAPLDAKSDSNTRSENTLRIVAFGLAKTRLWALQQHWKLLRALSESGFQLTVTLLGKRNEADDERAFQRYAAKIGNAIEWKQRFDLSPEEISRELAAHDLGLLANEPDTITKSGVFAAFALHGVVPVLSKRSNVSLRPSLLNAVFVNDDSELIPDILESLRRPLAVSNTGEYLLEFGARELSWERIGKSWLEVINLATGKFGHLDCRSSCAVLESDEAEVSEQVVRL